MSSDEPQAASDLPLEDLQPETVVDGSASFDALLEVSMPIVIEIGRTSMTVEEILKLGVGSVIELDRAVGEPVDVYVSDRKIAQGEVVVIGEHFGIRITHVLARAKAEAA